MPVGEITLTRVDSSRNVFSSPRVRGATSNSSPALMPSLCMHSAIHRHGTIHCNVADPNAVATVQEDGSLFLGSSDQSAPARLKCPMSQKKLRKNCCTQATQHVFCIVHSAKEKKMRQDRNFSHTAMDLQISNACPC